MEPMNDNPLDSLSTIDVSPDDVVNMVPTWLPNGIKRQLVDALPFIVERFNALIKTLHWLNARDKELLDRIDAMERLIATGKENES